MSLPSAVPFRKGVLKGTIYTFAEAGDELPTHSHDAHSVHISIITRGRAKAQGSWGEMLLDPLDVGATMVAFKPGQDHNLVALEPDTRVINIVYGSGLKIDDADLI